MKKNEKHLLIGLAVAGGLYLLYRWHKSQSAAPQAAADGSYSNFVDFSHHSPAFPPSFYTDKSGMSGAAAKDSGGEKYYAGKPPAFLTKARQEVNQMTADVTNELNSMPHQGGAAIRRNKLYWMQRALHLYDRTLRNLGY